MILWYYEQACYRRSLKGAWHEIFFINQFIWASEPIQSFLNFDDIRKVNHRVNDTGVNEEIFEIESFFSSYFVETLLVAVNIHIIIFY